MPKSKKYISIILFITIILLPSCSESIEESYDASPQKNFDALWRIINERYCYFNVKNINWSDVYSIYNKEISKVRNDFDLFDLMTDMLDTLQDGHVNLYSSFDISRCEGWFENYPTNFNNNIVYSDRYLGSNYKVAGGINYNKIANNKVGMIRYSSFSNNISRSGLRYIDKFFENCEGIIIDVRHNGGGSLTISEQFAASFFKKPTLTGYMKYKNGNGHDDFSEPKEFITDPANAIIDWSNKKVVLLCNRRCYSATNDFVVRMLHAPNVTVIGGKTGGGGGLPLSHELPNGWLIRFSTAPMFNSKMEHTEFGVFPDVMVNTSSEDEKNGVDAIIEHAINIITTNK